MKSENTGAGTSAVEVLNISPHGFWLMVTNREFFLGFDNFPWFCDATLGQLFHVEVHDEDHVYWPELDVDLDLDRIEHPEKYPLLAKSFGRGKQFREESARLAASLRPLTPSPADTLAPHR